jgi:restriction system protein
MRPVLAELAGGEELSQSELRNRVAKEMQISDEDRERVLPSGRQTAYANRIGWAITYLAKTRLVTRPRRGYAKITQRGLEILAANPLRVDLRVLSKFPEFDEFRSTHRTSFKGSAIDEDTATTETLSPTESIAAIVDDANSVVAADVLDRVIAKPPAFLERMVLKLLRSMGYGGLEADTQHLGGPGDEGLDGVIRQDALGLDVIYVQAKRYASDRKVTRPDIQGFVGALVGAKAERGIFITTSSFTTDALAYARRTVGAHVVLVDGTELAKKMVDRNVGVDVSETYELKRIDEDFFDE